MKQNNLQQLEADQRQYARERGHRAVIDGVVTDMRPVFDDLLLPTGFGVQRKEAPLHVLCFLYPTVLVYVPPTSEQFLRRRFGMSMETFVELQDKGLIKPIIGHPTSYANLPHLDPILIRKPASVWARGDEIAHSHANAEAYWQVARRLLPAEEIGGIKWVREKWRQHYPYLNASTLSAQILTEVRTNYVNLRIFGHHSLAEWAASSKNPDEVVDRLLLLNEFLTYPQLLGLGGTVNYGTDERVLFDAFNRAPLIPVRDQRLGEATETLLSALNLSFQGNPQTLRVMTTPQNRTISESR